MSTNHGKMSTNSKELSQLIDTAVKKIGGKKENDICRFLPISSGGYIHHFTMRKMKTEDPEKLAQMIKKHILTPATPKTVPPKPRRPRGSRKRGLHYLFSKEDIDRILNMARLAGDKEMIRKLTPRKDLRTLKRELISSIRHSRVEPELWNAYVEVMTTQEGTATNTAEQQTAKVETKR